MAVGRSWRAAGGSRHGCFVCISWLGLRVQPRYIQNNHANLKVMVVLYISPRPTEIYTKQPCKYESHGCFVYISGLEPSLPQSMDFRKQIEVKNMCFFFTPLVVLGNEKNNLKGVAT